MSWSVAAVIIVTVICATVLAGWWMHLVHDQEPEEIE